MPTCWPLCVFPGMRLFEEKKATLNNRRFVLFHFKLISQLFLDLLGTSYPAQPVNKKGFQCFIIIHAENPLVLAVFPKCPCAPMVDDSFFPLQEGVVLHQEGGMTFHVWRQFYSRGIFSEMAESDSLISCSKYDIVHEIIELECRLSFRLHWEHVRGHQDGNE
jgi:hypothetical protein